MGAAVDLPVVLLPVARLATTYTQVQGNMVVLYYMPLAFLLSLMLFYGMAAVPGIVLALFVRYYPSVGGYETAVAIGHFLIPITLSWGGYRVFAPRRNKVSYGDARLMAQRMFWQMFCPATIFLLLFQFAIYLGVYKTRFDLAGISIPGIRSLINYQGLLVGCLTGVPFCYLIIRTLRHPRYLRSLLSQIRCQIDRKVTASEVAIWLVATSALLALLLWPITENSTIFSTNYTLSLLMPVMLWGSMRFGYKLMSLIWTPVLIVSIHFFDSYIPGRRAMTFSSPSPPPAIWSLPSWWFTCRCWRRVSGRSIFAPDDWHFSIRWCISPTCGRSTAPWGKNPGRCSVSCVSRSWKC